jgi:hypothetical protein
MEHGDETLTRGASSGGTGPDNSLAPLAMRKQS